MAAKAIIGAVLTCAIAARFLKRTEDIEPADIELVLLYFSTGKREVFFSEKDKRNSFRLSVEASDSVIEDFMAMDATQSGHVLEQAATYVNTHRKLSKTFHRFDAGYCSLDVHHHAGEIKVIAHFDDGSMFDLFLTLADKKGGTGSGFGVKELSNDYGVGRQISYLHTLFGIDIPVEIVSDYFTIAHNDGSPSSETVFSATQYLYTFVAEEIKKHIGDDKLEYDFLTKVVKGIQTLESGSDENFEVVHLSGGLDYDIMDYDEVLKYLQLIDIDVKVPDDRTPMLKVFDKNSGKDIFHIRTKREKYASATTGYRYKIYFEPGHLLNYITKTRSGP